MPLGVRRVRRAVLFVQRVGRGAWCESTLIQGTRKNRRPTRGGSPVPCPGVTPGSRIGPLLRPHGLLGKEKVLTRTCPPPSPGMEQLESCRAGCVFGGEGILAWKVLEKALPLTS